MQTDTTVRSSSVEAVSSSGVHFGQQALEQ
jgi:hypothetical protein